MTRRVAITGVGLISPIGNHIDEVSRALREQRHGIVRMPEWAEIDNLDTRLAGVCRDLDPKAYPRKKVRSMGRVSLLSLFATEQALKDAGLKDDEARLSDGRCGLSYGSTHGSSSALEDYCRTLFLNNSLRGLSSTAYLKFMSHTTTANLAQYYQVRGRIVPTCSACTSGSQGVGYGYEAIKSGVQDIMITGGAEEMHFSHAGVFDMLFATSTRFNDQPDLSPRPFDAQRDGLVIAEGAGTLVLEELDAAKARGAHIYGEIIGYGTNCDGTHVTSPSSVGMAGAMRLALEDAGVEASEIDYVNAHGTATSAGDVAETEATRSVFGESIPISSTKSYTGHTLGACGAIEAIFCLAMQRDGFLPPTRNLEEIDPDCAPLGYLRGEVRDTKPKLIMSNNFAFGGINTSLIIKPA